MPDGCQMFSLTYREETDELMNSGMEILPSGAAARVDFDAVMNCSWFSSSDDFGASGFVIPELLTTNI